jgi:phage shock protein PspC (stress-responsive transcriptional regulator)
MNKVITINLNNNAYQVEEQGYDALQAYLDKAAAKLQDNPDKDEIMADLEQAIADKSAKYLNGHKNVITAKEVAEVITAMGPVEDHEPEEAATKTEPIAGAPRRLFKIREGAIFEGVCNGIAAYFDVDPTLVRVGFIILTILTGGAWILAYILMAIFVPEARTREDIASAQGKEFNARTVMEQAHDRYEYWKRFGKEQQRKWQEYEQKDKAYWKEWKQENKKWKHHGTQAAAKAHRAAFEKKHAWKHPTEPEEATMPTLGTRIGRGFAGWFGGIGVLVLIGMWLAWAFGVTAIFTNGTILGYFAGAPKLALLVLLAAVFFVVYVPVQGIVSDALRYASGKSRNSGFWGKVVVIALWFVAYAVMYLVAMNVSQIHDGFGQLWQDISHHL